ncbi:MAG: hypothetical protein K0S99_2294 [Thermomicrobiales bacterium]|nr:hypothetical protein [Thermomicrobiales bacterium]
MRRVTLFLAALMAAFSVIAPMSPVPAAAQEATPAMTYTCVVGASTPGAMAHEMPMTGTPAVGMDHMAMEFDQMYIDMMIPHHQSIIAMAQAALPRLQDERLREIASAVVETQGAEIAQLQEYREAWYGDPNSMPMDEAMMVAMEQMMPGMGDMEAMAAMMDSDALVAAFCAAENGDLTFIDLTIPHHEMAIAASEAALEQATHPEIKEVAQQVIEAQEREITELTEIRQRLAESARPSA